MVQQASQNHANTSKDNQTERDRDRFKELSEMLQKRMEEMMKEKEKKDGEMMKMK